MKADVTWKFQICDISALDLLKVNQFQVNYDPQFQFFFYMNPQIKSIA